MFNKIPSTRYRTRAQRKQTPQPELKTKEKEKRARTYQQRQLQRPTVRSNYSSSYSIFFPPSISLLLAWSTFNAYFDQILPYQMQTSLSIEKIWLQTLVLLSLKVTNLIAALLITRYPYQYTSAYHTIQVHQPKSQDISTPINPSILITEKRKPRKKRRNCANGIALLEAISYHPS